jgi:hypothetical protein
MKKLLEEEGIVGGGEGDGVGDGGSYVAELNKLTGIPHQEDTLLFAVPVCAPYLSVCRESKLQNQQPTKCFVSLSWYTYIYMPVCNTYIHIQNRFPSTSTK